MHFFSSEAYASWNKWCSTVSETLRDSLAVVTDFGDAAAKRTTKKKAPSAAAEGSSAEDMPADTEIAEAEPWGIHALPLDYEPTKEYVSKGQNVFDFEREGDCVICREAIASGEGLHALCSNDGCSGVGHLSCWWKHLLPTRGGADGDILPIQGRCPKCNGEVQWVDMMKELTLRTRGKAEIAKLLKTKRKRAVKAKTTTKATTKTATKAAA